MIAVIFEVEPHPGMADRYLDIAAGLRPLLDGVEGFVSIERFESLVRPGRYLSLSFWDSEEAVQAWRRQEAHRAAQQAGRSSVFAHYRLRVAQVLRDYGLDERAQAPSDAIDMGEVNDRRPAPPSS